MLQVLADPEWLRDLVTLLFDKLIVAALITILAVYLKRRIDRLKASDTLQTEIHKSVLRLREDLERGRDARLAELRIPAYRRLWALTGGVAITQPRLDREGRDELFRRLRDWYFSEEGGVALGDSSRDALLPAWFALKRRNIDFLEDETRPDPETEEGWAEIVALFSALRTALKNDLKVYGVTDASL